MKASILAIGTELTTGQVLNRNATTLSQKLNVLGIDVNLHLSVPDDRALILSSLDFLENSDAELLFITGGLGPTSDDFTRDVLAEWSGLTMKFNESSWNHIHERLTTRGYTVREMQKQQCYFPENAEILFNSEGTAHAFKFSARNKTLYVLPGPPREIEVIWKNTIQPVLFEKTRALDKLVTRSWDTIGIGESDVAFAVESALNGRPASGLKVGYRVHIPYVEVKLSFREAEVEVFKPWVQKVEEALANITVARDFEDPVLQACEKIGSLDFTFYDFVTHGYLHGRLASVLAKLPHWSFKQSITAPSVDLFTYEDNFLGVFPYEEDKCIVILSVSGQRSLKTIEAPMKAAVMSDRRRQYFAEMAIIELGK